MVGDTGHSFRRFFNKKMANAIINHSFSSNFCAKNFYSDNYQNFSTLN